MGFCLLAKHAHAHTYTHTRAPPCKPATGAVTPAGQIQDMQWAREIRGRISMARNAAKHRSLDISLEYKAELANSMAVQGTTVYAMSVKEWKQGFSCMFKGTVQTCLKELSKHVQRNCPDISARQARSFALISMFCSTPFLPWSACCSTHFLLLRGRLLTFPDSLFIYELFVVEFHSIRYRYAFFSSINVGSNSRCLHRFSSFFFLSLWMFLGDLPKMPIAVWL